MGLNRRGQADHVTQGTVHQTLVYAGDECVGWCQFGSPAELPNIKNPAAYRKELKALPTGGSAASSPAAGIAVPGRRAAVAATLDAIRAAGGGVVEAYPEQLEDRPPQRGAYLHTGPETLYEEFGFVRDRRIAKWRWVMRLDLTA